MKKKFPVNLAIDTSFFVKNNFLSSKNIISLKELYEGGIVKLHITDITYREIKNRFFINLKSTSEEIKKPLSMMRSKIPILRNFDSFESYFNLPEINLEELNNRFQRDLSRWIRELNVNVISTDSLTIREVFEDYFNSRPPFGGGDKKHEFPDAFTLQALNLYFQGNQELCHFISEDKDFSELNISVFYPFLEYHELIDSLIREHAEVELELNSIKFVEDLYRINRLEITQNLLRHLVESVESHADEVNGVVGDDDNVELGSVTFVDVPNIEIEDFKFMDLDVKKGFAILLIKGSFTFDVYFEGTDYSSAAYDSEDNKWLNLNEVDIHSEGTCDVEAYFRLDFILDNIPDSRFELDTVEFVDDIDIVKGIYYIG